ncbi:MAG TPA: hypothetical protein PKY59_05275 [Pyrinomonadaceae bacterium]|nr:hypothetical protein [Pyrinomonadaceae bacterium]
MKKTIFILAIIFSVAGLALAQGNAFSFQGKLNDGTSPANGRYDLEFKLFDAITGGTQIGPTVSRPGTTLINGVFSVALDFGAQAFQNPNSIFIEIAIRPFGSPNQLTILGPRQQLTVVPFASRSQNATNADSSQNSAQLGGVAASEYITRTNGVADFIRNSTQTQTNSNFNISGTGTINGNLSVGGNQSLTGNLVSNGSLQISGNARQDIAANGLVKAMLFVNSSGQVVRCYNGVNNTSTGNCGFTITFPLGEFAGVYRINFGFPISNRFVSVTARYPNVPANAYNAGANYREFDNTSIEVFMFATFTRDTTFGEFTLILY